MQSYNDKESQNYLKRFKVLEIKDCITASINGFNFHNIQCTKDLRIQDTQVTKSDKNATNKCYFYVILCYIIYSYAICVYKNQKKINLKKVKLTKYIYHEGKVKKKMIIS